MSTIIKNATGFSRWRSRCGMTRQQAADALGCTREAVRLWENGTNRIPRFVALACLAIEHGLVEGIREAA